MGALTPVSPWTPEDDLLLKNAVEAGASLEALAKGAMKFSHKFTIQEIQKRWHSLLYNPVVSAKAAIDMINFEYLSSTFPSKYIRGGNMKENKCFSEKRKAETVRSCYYALRKRICNEPFDSMDLSFLVAPAENTYIANEDKRLSGNCMLEDPVSSHFAFQETNVNMVHRAFPQYEEDSTSHIFHEQFNNVVQEFPIRQNLHQELHIPFVENLSDARNEPGVTDIQPEESEINLDHVNQCPSFDGDQFLNSKIAENGPSFHDLTFSSPLPEMPMWSDPASHLVLGENNLDICESFPLPYDGDDKNRCSSGFFANLDSNMKTEVPFEIMAKISELSDSLFTNDEELLLLDDGKDPIEKSYFEDLGAMLLGSPNDPNHDELPNTAEPLEATMACCLPSQSALDNHQGPHHGGDVACISEVQLRAHSSTINPQFPELTNGVIICVINTEDPEIPSNDHVGLPKNWCPKSSSSRAQQSFQNHAASNPSCIEGFSGNHKGHQGGALPRKREVENPGQSELSSLLKRSQASTKESLVPHADHGTKAQFRSSDPAHGSASIAYGGSTQLRTGSVSIDVCVSASDKMEIKETATFKHLSHEAVVPTRETEALGYHGCRCYPQLNAGGLKQQPNDHAGILSHLPSCRRALSMDAAPEQAVNNLISDSEDQYIESGDDVPYFSDIEALVLNMDLDSEDWDFFSSEKVIKYQHEETKKSIIRLEQGAHSYMQRAIASHEAFAVLYGHHTKHYIKKPEVLLGRATEDVVIDIDLGREGRASKISRRQAIISLDKDGSFHMKNLGKSSIYVNDAMVAPGRTQGLTSSCLIEIRGMAFIFEMNQMRVQQYLDSVSKPGSD